MLLVWKWGGRFSGIIATSNQTWIERTVAECRLKAPNHPHEETPPPSPAPIKVPTLRLPHPSTHPASLGCPILGTGGPCRHREGLSPHGAASQGQPWVLWFGFLIRYGKVKKSFCTISWESRCLKLFQECFCCHFRTIRFWNTQILSSVISPFSDLLLHATQTHSNTVKSFQFYFPPPSSI